MNSHPVVFEQDGHVALLRLASANQLNPLTDELVDALVAALRRIDADPSIHAAVLMGSSKAFAAGADIAAMSKLDYASVFQQDYIGRNWDAIRTFRKPLIAAINGYALGGGCELTMLCDIAIASDDAVFGQPEVRLGIVPGAGGTQRLPRAVGKSMAMQLCLTGASISATEALEIGLVSKVVSGDKLLPEAMSMAHEIAAHSLPVVLAIKEAVNRSFETSLAEGLLFERRIFHAGFALQDQTEGMNAFLERRQPNFVNG
ncbi:enoyl-CoA hydratase-related protein [Cupriavidus lacunae]|uniref:Enoyl-CoA hydratase n=1 Tax=Cupriavidus lacunae TaxID=2666307 RepID=A0A370NJG0_9BURK|nr:enoyl-CoA hydratase-related protein [Cupriavidus lacunae]RDK05727.1 enoyl-CoA hydratase [Cupriavidus lacunae]